MIKVNLINEKKKKPRRNKEARGGESAGDAAKSTAATAGSAGSAVCAAADSDSDDSVPVRRSMKRGGDAGGQFSGQVTVEGGGGRAVGDCRE